MKQAYMIIFVTIVTAVYTAVAWYVYSRGIKAFETALYAKIFRWTYWVLVSSFFFGQMLERGNPGALAGFVSRVGSVWLAFFMYALLFVLVVDLFRLAHHYFNIFPASVVSNLFSAQKLFALGFSVALLTTVWGYINAKNPIIKHIDIEIDKKQSTVDSLRVVLATDVHLGVLLGKDRAQKLMEQINDQKPDLVLFAGDLVDHNPVPVVKNNMGACFEKINSTYGIYAITGNHEYIGKPDISIDYFVKHGVKYIRDSIISIDGVVQIAGREDREKIRFTGQDRKSLNDVLELRDEHFPTILLDHQPVEYDEVANVGIDLMLSGHTHKGQLWPLGFITRMVYENDFGLMKKGDSQFYTSSGYGTWGPPVRTGNRPELVVFHIKFK